METTMYSLRILSHGKITNLNKGFSLKDGEIFSLFLRPKKATMETSVLANVRLTGDQAASEFPLPVGDWTPAAIMEVAPNAINLSEYDVFWGSGSTNAKINK